MLNLWFGDEMNADPKTNCVAFFDRVSWGKVPPVSDVKRFRVKNVSALEPKFWRIGGSENTYIRSSVADNNDEGRQHKIR